MIGKIIGAMAGAKAAEHSRKMGGTTGALLGAAAVPLIRRLGLPVIVAGAVGAWAVNRYSRRNHAGAGETGETGGTGNGTARTRRPKMKPSAA